MFCISISCHEEFSFEKQFFSGRSIAHTMGRQSAGSSTMNCKTLLKTKTKSINLLFFFASRTRRNVFNNHEKRNLFYFYFAVLFKWKHYRYHGCCFLCRSNCSVVYELNVWGVMKNSANESFVRQRQLTPATRELAEWRYDNRRNFKGSIDPFFFLVSPFCFSVWLLRVMRML